MSDISEQNSEFLEEVCEVLIKVFNIPDLYTINVYDEGRNEYEIKFDTSGYKFKFRVAIDNQCEYKIIFIPEDKVIFTYKTCNFNKFVSQIESVRENGIPTLDSNVYYPDFDINGVSKNELDYGFDSQSPNPTLNGCEDEEVEATPVSGKFANDLAGKPNSHVDGEITQIRVVPLKFEGVVIAYRFKTNLGAFDMSKSTAAKFNVDSIKSDKFITLERVNGILMSSTEKKIKKLVPDVSDCDEDCIKLINAMFEA